MEKRESHRETGRGGPDQPAWGEWIRPCSTKKRIAFQNRRFQMIPSVKKDRKETNNAEGGARWLWCFRARATGVQGGALNL